MDIVAGEVRQHRRNAISGTSSTMLPQQVMEVTDRLRQNEESSEQVRQLLEAPRTAGQMLEERMNRTEASVRYTSQAGGNSAAMAQEAPGADDGRFGFGEFAVRYQPENFHGEDTGWRDWSRVFRTWAGRFQRGRVQEIIRSVQARPGDEATLTELDLRLEDWASAELKSIAADFNHALIFFCKRNALKIVLTNKEGEGFEAWRALVNKYEPTSKASVVGKLVEILRTPFDGDFLDALTTFERKIMIYEVQSRETISDSLKLVARHCWNGPEQYERTSYNERHEMRQLDEFCSRG